MVELVNHCLANGIMTDRVLKAAVRCQVRVLFTYKSSPVILFCVGVGSIDEPNSNCVHLLVCGMNRWRWIGVTWQPISSSTATHVSQPLSNFNLIIRNFRVYQAIHMSCSQPRLEFRSLRVIRGVCTLQTACVMPDALRRLVLCLCVVCLSVFCLCVQSGRGRAWGCVGGWSVRGGTADWDTPRMHAKSLPTSVRLYEKMFRILYIYPPSGAVVSCGG